MVVGSGMNGDEEPRGWYLAGDVGRLAGVSGREIGQWTARGYIKASRGAGNPHVYAYQDVREALIVHDLHERGVPFEEIRNILKHLGKRYGQWPLAHAPLKRTVPGGRGRDVVLVDYDGITFDVGHQGAEQVWPRELGELIQVDQYLRRGGWVIRTHPEIERVEVNPKRLGGQPTVKGRRLPIDTVVGIAAEKGGRQLLRSDYDLQTAEIEDALRWAKAVAEFATAA
jgi:uncharacterized protein (DUF433 family)/DNA-binding transcriptional MerR regulator